MSEYIRSSFTGQNKNSNGSKVFKGYLHKDNSFGPTIISEWFLSGCTSSFSTQSRRLCAFFLSRMSLILQQELLSVSQISNETNMEPLPMRETLPKPNYIVFLNISQPLRAGSICMNWGGEWRGTSQTVVIEIMCRIFPLSPGFYGQETRPAFGASFVVRCATFSKCACLTFPTVLFDSPPHVIHWDDIIGAEVRIYKCKEHNVRKRAKHASRRHTRHKKHIQRSSCAFTHTHTFPDLGITQMSTYPCRVLM